MNLKLITLILSVVFIGTSCKMQPALNISTECIETQVSTEVVTIEDTIVTTESESIEVTTTEPADIYELMWTNTKVYFRSAPEYLEDTILMVLRQGTQVTVINYNSATKWVEAILEDGTTGFIYSNTLSYEYVTPYRYYMIKEGGAPEYLSIELQEYVQDILIDWDMEDFYELFICQAYQESRFRMDCVSGPHGGYYDWGIMQIWEGLEHDRYSPMYETLQYYRNYKTDPYENLYCGLIQFKQWYEKTGDYIIALGCYYSGNHQPNQKYIEHVLSHKPNILNMN